MPRRFLLALAFALSATTAAGSTPEKVAFAVTGAFERGAEVVGELRLPDATPARVPAVVIINSSPGLDGRSALYAQALNRAGFATLEADMFQGRGLPASPRHNLPHAYQSLQYLASHPRIDGARVGVMGFSWGGGVAVLASSERFARQFAGDGPRFAAHMGLYPVCWRHHLVVSDPAAGWKDMAGAYDRVTGRPVHILVGDRDDYGPAATCTRFVAALPTDVRPHFEVTVYPGATFAWDSRFDSAVYERGANEGKGGLVTVVADPATTARSVEAVVTWFSRHLRHYKESKK